MTRPAPETCTHTFPSTGRSAASGGHDDHLRCAMCATPMVWNGTRYVPKSDR